MHEPILQTHGLSRRFGGLTAVNDISLSMHHSEVHAVIGPNGAGKSTLINLLSGDLKPSSGSIRYHGSEIAGMAADRIARLGIARSYQITNIFPDFTVFENCRLAAQSKLTGAMRFLRPANSYKTCNEAAERAVETVGLQGKIDDVAATLSHGEQRQLEIAMALVNAPPVLLLDEPLCGMGAEESQRMTGLIKRLSAHHAIMLVEHDMDAVFSVADTLTVMVDGKVLETGAPHDIRQSRTVQEAYLGTEELVA